MKLFNRSFVVSLLVQFWFMLSFFMSQPLVAQFIVDMGETTALAGFVAGVFSLLALVWRPVSGFLTDRYYHKYVLALGFIMCSLSYLGYAVSPNFVVVLLFRITHALGLCIQTTLMAVVAMEYIPKNRTVEGIGWISIAAVIGMGNGPAVGVALVGLFGHRVTFALSGICMAATIGLLAFLPIERRKPKPSEGFSITSFVSTRTLPIMFTMMAFGFCVGLPATMLVLVGDVRGIAGIAFFFTISSLGAAVVRPFSGKLVDRKGLQAVMPLTFVAEAACMVLIAFAQSLTPILIAAVARVFGQGIAQPSLQGQALKECLESERGKASATFFMGIDIGQGISGIIGGIVADAFGFTAMFLTGPIALVGGVFAYMVWYRRHKLESVLETTAKEE